MHLVSGGTSLIFISVTSALPDTPVTNLVWQLADAATDPAFGDIFFTNLTRRLSEALGVSYAFVGELQQGTPARVRFRAFWANGENPPNFEYSLADTPCEKVAGGEMGWYSEGICDFFPKAGLLRQMKVESYIGVPLYSSRHEVLGIMVLMHDKPVPEDERLRHLLHICASRAGAELERLKIETQLKISEARLLACVQTTPHVAVQWYDEQGVIRFWNKASEIFYGWTAQEMIGRTLRGTVLTENAARAFAEIMARVAQTGQPSEPKEFEVRRRDGTLGYSESTLFSIPGENEGTWFVCMDVDITARRHAEQELRASEAHYRHLIESSPLAMLVTDIHQRVIFANTKFTELFGYTIEDVPDLESWWPTAWPDPVQRARMKEEWASRLQVAFSTGRPADIIETEIRCKDGAVRRIQANASLCSDRLLVVLTDLTERARLEHELRQAQKLEVVGQLAGGVAHDFNNIIQAVLGFIGLAQDPSLEIADRDVYLREALSAAKRASQLTRQLLAFGRRQPLHFEDTHLPELVNDILKLLRRLIGENIEIGLVASKELGSVRCDRTQVEQVLINLCVNARDAMPNGGRITIEIENKTITPAYKHAHPWARVGRFVMMKIADTGCGMDKATQERVFEPFFTTKTKDKGTGLGLAVVYGIVRQHEGFIRLNSELGIGTTFSIYLPVAELAAGAQAQKKLYDPAAGGSETILVAEDDETIRTMVRRILARAGYNVLTAVDGEDAVRMFEANADRVNMLVFDAVMPKLSGFEAFERIRHRCNRRLPAIFASGYNDAFTQSNAQLPEDTALMQKPYDLDELLRQIRALLSGPLQPTGTQGAVSQ
ncbi:MAG: PAS domain S-box protein [Opitutaceae bacterium]